MKRSMLTYATVLNPTLPHFLKCALLLSVDMKELITDKRNAMIEKIMRDKIIS